MAITGRRSPLVSIFSMARSERGSSSSTVAGNSRRSASWTVTSLMPSMLWWLVMITPSARTMAPEPSEPCTWSRVAPPPPPMKKSQNGSTRWRTTRLLATLTMAGAVFFTTGANEAFIDIGSVGARRVGWARSGMVWALEGPCGEQAASRARAGSTTR
jgi:hypothetical protein